MSRLVGLGTLSPMQSDAAAARRYLARMIGAWQLDGRMGARSLHQAVDARWTLGGRFVEMRCTQTDTAPGEQPYEALYQIGHDERGGELIMHLLDSTTVTPGCQVGRGTLADEIVDFVFEYPTGPFHNRFSYDPAEDAWTHELEDEASGEKRPFAHKRLIRAALERAENAGILAYLRERTGTDVIHLRRPPDDVDRYALGAHPDVVERLWGRLNAALPEDAAFLVGHGPALVHPHSRIVVALALGTQYALRLPAGRVTEAMAAGATEVHTFATSGGTLDLRTTLGPGWVFGAWSDAEGEWLAESHAAANL